MERFLDPIVEETRDARQQVWEEGGGTLEGLWILLADADRLRKLRGQSDSSESAESLATAGARSGPGKLITKVP